MGWVNKDSSNVFAKGGKVKKKGITGEYGEKLGPEGFKGEVRKQKTRKLLKELIGKKDKKLSQTRKVTRKAMDEIKKRGKKSPPKKKTAKKETKLPRATQDFQVKPKSN